MRKTLLPVVAAALVTTGAAAAPQTSRMDTGNLFPFMPKAKTSLSRTTVTTAAGQQKAPAVSSLPTSDESGYLNGPNGATWFYTMEYKAETIQHESYTEQKLTGFKLTVYNDKFESMGSVEDEYELQPGETRIAAFSIGPTVTKSFFNYDKNYEVMMGVATNTDQYVNNYRTYAYSLDNNEPIATFDGYYCSAINSATDAWSENFWITFMTQEETETPDVNGVLNTADYRFRTYKKAGYGGMGDAVIDVRFPSVALAGADAQPFLANVGKDGIPYFAVNHLKYSWYADPYDYENENPTPDNELIIDIYAPKTGWASTVDKYCTTTIPMNPTADDLYFMYFGNFNYDNDLNFDVNEDGTPVLYVTRAHSSRGGETFTYDYEVYEPAAKGETAAGTLKFAVAKGVSGGTFMSDVKGFAPQVMFIDDSLDGLTTFNFVNTLTGETEHSIAAGIDPENPQVTLTSNTDRLPQNGSYVYYAPQTRGASDDQGNVSTSVVFVDPETGKMVGKDVVNLGKNVEYAQLYTAQDAFDPYIFNLDETREYMALVKRRAESGNDIVEQLVVASTDPEKAPILTLGPDKDKGTLANIFFANLHGENPKLAVIYQNTENWNITLDSYDLPLVGFENGDGTVDNPYEISTVGGLKQIGAAPAAHYVIVADIDADGYTISNNDFDFKGSLDGRGHKVSDLNLDGYALIPSLTIDTEAAADAPQPFIKDIDFVNPTFNATHDNQGLLVGHMTGGTVEDIHVYGGKVNGTESVAGLVGQASIGAKILGCSFSGDVVSTGSGVGGIVINTMTDASVQACAFKGNIEGSQTLGGIVSSLYPNSGQVSDCHVNASIKGKNTIGGIAGSSSRGVIKNCHVQGTLEASEAPMYGAGGPLMGGIVGQLERGFENQFGEEEGEGEETTPSYVVQGCYVNLTSMTFTGEYQEEEFAGQNDTMHRIVGWSSINAWPEEIGYDEETWEPIYGDPAPAEAWIKDNYAVATLAVGNEKVEAVATSTEGASVQADETGTEFFSNLGWLYGNDIENPWNQSGDQQNPSLFFEGGLLILTPAQITLKVNQEAECFFQLLGEEITEEMVEGFSFEIANEEIATLSDARLENGGIQLAIFGQKEGTTEMTCYLNGKSVKASITVEADYTGVEGVVAEGNALSFDGTRAYADGCVIKVFSTTGACVLSGNNVVSLDQLQGGVYILTAINADGKRSALKVNVK